MSARSLIRSLKPSHAIPGACLLLIAFFAQHAFFDDHGLRRLLTLSDLVAKREAELATERAAREAEEARVQGLYGSSLDLDLLDERARAALGAAQPDEIVIFKPKTAGEPN